MIPQVPEKSTNRLDDNFSSKVSQVQVRFVTQFVLYTFLKNVL
jgi:hypothetical protein